jgi:hypothetical protein
MNFFVSAITVLTLFAIGESSEAAYHSVCDACVADVSGLHSHLTASNNLRDKMQLRSSVCGPLPVASQVICEQAIEQILPSLEIKLRNAAMVCPRDIDGVSSCHSSQIFCSGSDKDGLPAHVVEASMPIIKDAAPLVFDSSTFRFRQSVGQ